MENFNDCILDVINEISFSTWVTFHKALDVESSNSVFPQTCRWNQTTLYVDITSRQQTIKQSRQLHNRLCETVCKYTFFTQWGKSLWPIERQAQERNETMGPFGRKTTVGTFGQSSVIVLFHLDLFFQLVLLIIRTVFHFVPRWI